MGVIQLWGKLLLYTSIIGDIDDVTGSAHLTLKWPKTEEYGLGGKHFHFMHIGTNMKPQIVSPYNFPIHFL